jgi:hypothetical protein
MPKPLTCIQCKQENGSYDRDYLPAMVVIVWARKRKDDSGARTVDEGLGCC